MLGVEYLNRFETYLLNSAADTVRFVRDVEHPNCRMMYDTFHANIEEKSIPEAIRSLHGLHRARATSRKTTAARPARGTSTGPRRSTRSKRSATTAG